jgi:hypothetical protein
MRERLKKFGPIAGFIVLMFVGTYIYLYPGSSALIEKRTDFMMSDGTDPTSAPRQYELLNNLLHTHPSRLLYGSVWVDVGDPQKGYTLTIPFSERILTLLTIQFFPPEQVATAFIFLLMVLSGLSMYLLCAYMGWSWWISYALSFAWAINVYTRARAKVHGAFVGTFHLPLIFLGFFLIVKGKSRRSLIAAQLALLVAGTVAHYYVITCMFLTPIFLLFIFFQPEFRSDRKRICKRFGIAAIPLVLFLGLNYLYMLPPEAPLTKEEAIRPEVTEPGVPHLFLKIFHAYPLDYLSGDIALVGTEDWNPLRAEINEYIRETLGYGNAHERSNGIRWSVILLVFAAFIYLLRGKFKPQPFIQKNLIYFFIFGFFAYWLSMAPDVPMVELNPSYWLYRLMPKIRVSNRAGIIVHFSMLMIVGFFLSYQFKNSKWQKFLLYPGVLLAVFVLDYLPLQSMPMAPVMPAYQHLARENGPCEVGMIFPYVNSATIPIPSYFACQRMRGSDCKFINEISAPDQVRALSEAFPPEINYINGLPNDEVSEMRIKKLVDCVPLNWVAFLQPVSPTWAQKVCDHLGWQFFSDMTCSAPLRNQPMRKMPKECL